MKTYLAIFQPVEEGGFFIRFPDVEGALTQGHDLEEGFEMATDALALILVEFPKLPRASKSEDLAPTLEPGEFLVPIPVDEKLLHKYRPKERVNIMLPADVLADLDAYRATTGEDRSALLAEGARMLLEQKGA
ncbi:MAG: type II toxin-antitoxin system HicB family antitoxin [bacterium]|nr:type II toxin-antitoxin system HicB family antitoxin [bacterium]